MPGSRTNQLHLLLLILLLIPLQLLGKGVGFREISPKGGFTFGAIHNIIEDRHGFIWLGTRHGIFRYNSERIDKFNHIPFDNNSIPSNYITAITKDLNQQLWFASDNGIFFFDEAKETFEHCNFRDNYGQVLNANTRALLCDQQGYLWSINNNRLNKINTTTQIFERITLHPNDSLVNYIMQDKNDQLWVKSTKGNVYWSPPPYEQFHYFGPVNNQPIMSMLYTKDKLWIAYESDGVACYDKNGALIQRLGHVQSPNNNLKSNRVREIVEDRNGNLWFATYNGIAVLHPEGHFSYLNSNNTEGLKHSSIYAIYIDSKDGIWVGTWSGTLSYHHADDNFFDHLSTQQGLSNMVVSSITEGRGLIWIGTEGGGLHTYNPQTKEVEKHHLNTEIPFEENIKALEFDAKGALWVGTFNNGIWYIDKFDDRGHPLNPRKLFEGEIYDITFSASHAWIASYFSGLYQIDLKTLERKVHLPDTDNPISLHTNHIRSLLFDSFGGLWVGTQTGLSYKSSDQPGFKRPLKEHKHEESNFAYPIYCLHQDTKNNLWIGTSAGLYKHSLPTNMVEKVNIFNIAPAFEVYGIAEDDSGNLWISTDLGIIQFHLADGNTRLFTAEDGLQGNQFNPGSVFKSRQGELFFGGPNGLTIFNPADIKTNLTVAKPVVVELLINNQLQKPSQENAILKASILTTKQLNLKHHQNSLTFHFIASNFLSPQKNKFSYRLVNYNDEWNTGLFRSASFTKIPPGRYVFQLKAANNDGIWNEKPLEIPIHISYPWWQQWYAFLFYLSLSLTVGWIIHREKKTKQKLLHDVFMEKLRSQQEAELTQSKLSFFTNISHEVKTPLSLILSPLDHLIRNNESNQDLNDTLKIIQRNASRLKHLLHQLIDIRRIEANELSLQKESLHTLQSITEIVDYFTLEARERGIKLEINCQNPEIKTTVDKDKFEKTVFNLLTNAFKYANDGGFIKISQQETRGSLTPLLGAPNGNLMLEISVFNSGSYIPTNAQTAIFERFFQLQSAKTQGTGIGLNMVKEYVLLHNGQIDVLSLEEEGTTFFIRFPREHTGEKAISTNHNHLNSSATSATPFTKDEEKPALFADKQTLVMVVEDNADLRALLRKILNPYYSVVTAQNGRLALEKIEDLHPDLIISDVLMPEMNGFELCAKLKTSVETNHIPIILLTALNSEENQIKGYDTGADIYLPKPFSEPLLLTHAKNLITSRLKLKERYLNPSMALTLSEEEVPGLSFLAKAETIVNEHLLNPSFTVETLAEKLNISRASLHRKLKNQTDQSATEFIRFIRLKAAIKLLKAGNSSLSEIAYNVGFSSPSYFSISFKKQFGKSPKEFMEDNL